MADSDYIDNPFPIVDVEYNSVVANSDTPQVLFAVQFTRPERPRFLGKSFDPRYHSPYRWNRRVSPTPGAPNAQT